MERSKCSFGLCRIVKKTENTMTPTELLSSFKGKLTDALSGFPDPPAQSINKIRQQPRTPADIRLTQDVGGRFTPKGGGKFQMPMFSSTPKVPGSKVQPLVNTNPIGLNPKPNYPGPAGNLQGLKGGGATGGLVTGLASVAGSMVIPHIAREAVRGGLVVTGQDTTGFDDFNAGRPVVKNFGGVSYNIATPEGLRGALKAKEKGKEESAVTPPKTPPKTPPVGPPTPSADPRNTEYLTARNALTKDSSTADIQAVEDKGMAAWAKANPGLASKVKSGQSGYGLIQNIRGQGTDAYDANETFKPSDIPEADRQNPVEQAKARGITNLQDAQSFKNTAMDALLTASQDPNVTPIVEGMTIPTTTNYAGAFNQADMPDLQSMMNMGEELGSLGIEGPRFAQSQKFKDLFMNTMLGK